VVVFRADRPDAWYRSYQRRTTVRYRCSTVWKLRPLPGQLHPRLALPFGIALWGDGLATDIRGGIALAAGSPGLLLDWLAGEPHSVPLPCDSQSCRVRVRDGALVVAEPHEGCKYEGRPAGTVPNWAKIWFADDRSSVGLGEAALLTVADAADRLARGEDWSAVQWTLADSELSEQELGVRYGEMDWEQRSHTQWSLAKAARAGTPLAVCPRCSNRAAAVDGACSAECAQADNAWLELRRLSIGLGWPGGFEGAVQTDA
jgi:hypothetical protein